MFDNALNLVLIIIGFGLVIVIHELGHFLAAKWAGIRVHAFAVGFGQAVCSFRKGMGFRFGSSEPEYVKRLKDADLPPDRGDLPGVSATEYRLNWIPFGGYVKMLGQEDMDPAARSDAPDAYNNTSVGKRLVVISAGVVMNVILAAVLFGVVFGVGMRTPPAVVGFVSDGGAASVAGVRAGDVVTHTNGKPVDQFAELAMVAAMTKSGKTIDLTIRRPGEPEPIELAITPTRDEASKLMQLGIGGATSNVLWGAPEAEGDLDLVRRELDRLGLEGVGFGAQLVSVNNEPVEEIAVTSYANVTTAFGFARAIERSNGVPVAAEFKNTDGQTVLVSIEPKPEYEIAEIKLTDGVIRLRHLLGLAPVMGVQSVQADSLASRSGLLGGDVFARIGDIAWPSYAEGIGQIRAHAGGAITLAVLRDDELVELEGTVSQDGRMGFFPRDAVEIPVLASVPEPEKGGPLAASRLEPAIIPGMRVSSVNGAAVRDFASLRAAIIDATNSANANGTGENISLGVAIGMMADNEAAEETLAWAIEADDVRTLHALGWDPIPHLSLFQGATYIRKAQSPVEAVTMGVGATRDMLVRTYMTFLRLFDGTVRVEHLRGPVGIADVGVQFASQGFIHILFFLALISANLAVINFLPIPFVDGGHVVFLLIEGATRRPVPVVVQNVATLAGLGLIGVVFLVVTFNDISRLFG